MESNKQQGGAAVQEAPVPQTAPVTQSAPVAQETPAAQAESAPRPVRAKQPEPVQMAKTKRTVIYTIVVFLYYILVKLVFFMRFEGRENIPKDKNVILMGNHQCLLDPVTLALCARDREIHFMGKKELWNNRLLGWVFTQVHGFPVDRGNMDMGAIRTAMNVLKGGETLGIFPEGTRSRTGHMLPLLSGASMLALRSGCEVIPVYIDGRYRPFHRITVRVGTAVEMDDLRAGRVTKESCDALTGRIEESFFRLSGGKSRAPEAE